ncbi:hypothetical protein D2Q93_13685 [Alicyclobacillaceae bacterium I2511]|nr:hypothetical protein D2Q93_13685 [Alicyclobacillaceae bacterium I2511]
MVVVTIGLLLGLVVGWIRKGSFWALGNLSMRGLWLVALAFFLQSLAIHSLHGTAYILVLSAGYVGMMGFAGLNLHTAGIPWMATGTVANFTVMVMNGMGMPAYLPVVQHYSPQLVPLLLAGRLGKSIAMTPDTRLNFLGDIFTFKVASFVSLFSVGDVLIAVGLAVLLQYLMTHPKGGVVSGSIQKTAP